MSIIKEVVTYHVYGYKFKSKKDAEDFVAENYFVYDDYDDEYKAVSRSSLVRYENMLKEDKDRLFELYRDLANSNSMGSIWALTAINLVFGSNNISMDDVWREQ